MRDDQRPPSSDELGERIRRAQEARHSHRPLSEPQSRQFGVGYRVFVEMLAGVLVGAGLGWFFDQLLGTRPWLLVVMLIMGFAAGMLNAYRSTRRMIAAAERESRSDNAGDAGGG